MTNRTFTIEADDLTPRTITCDGHTAKLEYKVSGFYAALIYGEDDFIYECKDYSTGGKVKRTRIPFSILVDITELLHVLNRCRSNEIMCPTRIYEDKPFVTLFPKETK